MADPYGVEEVRFLGAVSETRLRDFATGRACSRDALGALTSTGRTVGTGPDGGPVWPSGFVGSITHCDGVYAAAVAPTSRFRAIGIDAEPLQDLCDGMLAIVQTDAERRQGARGVMHADLVSFSAKESIYKVWHPLTRSWLDFLEATVTVEADGTFAATIQHDRAADVGLERLHGRWAVSGATVFTAIALPPAAEVSSA